MLRTIRFRLTLWYSTIVAVTFAVIAFATYQFVARTLGSSVDQAVINEAKWVTARLERQAERSEPDSVLKEEFREHSAFFPFKEYVEIWDSTGDIFYQSVNLVGDTLVHHVADPSDHRWLLLSITTFRDQNVRLVMSKTASATILVGMPTEFVAAAQDRLLTTLAWMGPAVLVIAVLGGTFLAKKSLSKVNKVTEAAKRITADRLSERIPDTPVDDEIGNLIATFNAMISRLDASFEQMKQFSGDASHELRTPLTVIRTQLETALNSGDAQAETKQIIAHCLDEAIRMSGTIENLLLLARSDSGQVSLRHDRVDLKALIEETYEESIILASEKAITVTLQKADMVTVSGDEHRLRQMLLNLIDNAIKYSRQKGAINLRLVKDQAGARIVVSDNGIGIPSDEIPRIFDRFYRVDRARSREMGGAGLGLSITRWIVEAHGGTIAVQSDLRKGSEFTVVLPLAPPP
jgi:heavy metal sensor kinase